MSWKRYGRNLRWLVVPLVFFVSLEVVLHHLDWPLGLKFAVVLGAPAVTGFMVPRGQVKWVFLSLLPLLALYWLWAGGTAGTTDAPSGSRAAGTRLSIELINLSVQFVGFIAGMGARAILRPTRSSA